MILKRARNKNFKNLARASTLECILLTKIFGARWQLRARKIDFRSQKKSSQKYAKKFLFQISIFLARARHFFQKIFWRAL